MLGPLGYPVNRKVVDTVAGLIGPITTQILTINLINLKLIDGKWIIKN